LAATTSPSGSHPAAASAADPKPASEAEPQEAAAQDHEATQPETSQSADSPEQTPGQETAGEDAASETSGVVTPVDLRRGPQDRKGVREGRKPGKAQNQNRNRQRRQAAEEATKETGPKGGAGNGPKTGAGANKAAAPRPQDAKTARNAPGAGPAEKAGPVAKKAAANAADKIVVQPTVRKASRQGRHWMILFSFLMLVGLPSAVTGWYLWERAVDQYASFVGFSVRTEEKGSAIELLGSVTDLSGSSSTDTDILFEFLQSQELVAAIDEKLDLRSIWSKADPQVDPVFAYHPPGTIEDLVDHWDRMVKVYYDSGTGLIDLRVLAFDPVDATTIATEIYARANARINELSAVAREDAIGYAREELAQAEDRLRQARIDIQAFRNRTQIIDPTIQTQTQSGLIGALETQLAEAQIERRLLEETARKGDPRITQSELKIDVIRAQIAEERGKLGLETADGVSSVADLVGEYEALAVDLEFAQQAYTAARATFDASRNEARRQSRYLAAHVTPTKAEQAKYPERPVILGLISMFLFLTWSVVVLVAYALRDRR
jgi:capsular polysaccharide transport system permease protein